MNELNDQFEIWVVDRYEDELYAMGNELEPTFTHYSNTFQELPFSMQWGVYLEFFDSVGIYIYPRVKNYTDLHTRLDMVRIFHLKEITRTEAQQEAIKKAFEILNKQK